MVPIRNSTADHADLLGRPLSARSVIASLLLGMTEPRLRGARLVQWCALFGIAAGTARVALHRMCAAGELVASDGIYALAGPLIARQAHQDWSLRPQLLRWSGDWRLCVIAPEKRAAGDRQALRNAMRRLRFAERREGLWLRPDNLPREAAPADAHAVAAAQCSWWRARPDSDPAALAAELFALAPWAARGRALAERLDGTTAKLRTGDLRVLADAFVLGAAALQHLRRDPLLPPALVPSRWPGNRLRAAYADYRQAFGAAAARWFRGVEHTAPT